MNKILSLDIQFAAFTPLLFKEERDSILMKATPRLSRLSDERIAFLFHNSPKVHIAPSTPSPRKEPFSLIKFVEIFKALFHEQEKSNIHSEIFAPQPLSVPQLPSPPFQISSPAHFFWHPASNRIKEEYAPACLMSESKEGLPKVAPHSEKICRHARQILSQKGILRQDSHGLIYLELPDSFITELVPLICDAACENVPLYHLKPSPAHVPVILADEWSSKKGWGEILELEETFSFEIQQLCTLKPNGWPHAEKIYFFSLKSPELEKFRERRLLPPLIRGHAFHVAIAYKKAPIASQPAPETYRLNVSCYAA